MYISYFVQWNGFSIFLIKLLYMCCDYFLFTHVGLLWRLCSFIYLWAQALTYQISFHSFFTWVVRPSRHGHKAHIYGYLPEPNSNRCVFLILIEYEFFLILKHGYETSNEDISTNPKFILKSVLNVNSKLICALAQLFLCIKVILELKFFFWQFFFFRIKVKINSFGS